MRLIKTIIKCIISILKHMWSITKMILGIILILSIPLILVARLAIGCDLPITSKKRD